MSGCRSGRGFAPLRSVGAITHWPAASSEVSEQLLTSQPLAAIHLAPGATPTWLPAPSSPTIVPMVWVPWLLLSHGTSAGWLYWTPVSMLATTTPSPRTPKSDQTRGASMLARFHSTVFVVGGAICVNTGLSSGYVRTVSILATSLRVAIIETSPASPLSQTALAIQNDV